MATRGLIVKKFEDGFHAVYNHWDSYPEYLGKVLDENYNIDEKSTELIEAGKNGFSVIRETIEKCECYPDDDPTPVEIVSTFDDVLSYSGDVDAEYVYLFNPETNKWDCTVV